MELFTQEMSQTNRGEDVNRRFLAPGNSNIRAVFRFKERFRGHLSRTMSEKKTMKKKNFMSSTNLKHPWVCLVVDEDYLVGGFNPFEKY